MAGASSRSSGRAADPVASTAKILSVSLTIFRAGRHLILGHSHMPQALPVTSRTYGSVDSVDRSSGGHLAAEMDKTSRNAIHRVLLFFSQLCL